MNSPLSHIKLFLTALVAVLMLTVPASAMAAGSVSVAVGSTDVQAPSSGSVIQTYSYNLTFDSVPDHATVDIVGPNGTLAMPTITRDLHGAQSPVAGSGEVAVTKDLAAGYYTVKVAYFSTGSSQWEARASKVFRVIAPKPDVVIPDPPPPTTTTTTTPPVTTTVTTPPVTTTPPVVIPPQATEDKTTIHLVKRAVRRTVKPGHLAPFVLTVKNTGTATAKAVKVCDRIPAHTTVSSLGGGKLTGGKVCWSVGNLVKGKSATRQLTLRVDNGVKVRTIVNHATATASNAPSVKAQAQVKVPKAQTPTAIAPVTG